MAKSYKHSIVLDSNRSVTFTDQFDTTHKLLWDNIEKRFYFDNEVEATRYINATNAHKENRDPLPTDNTYLIPTIWINSATLDYFILLSIETGYANWQEITAGSASTVDERIVINTGTEPGDPEALDLWFEGE